MEYLTETCSYIGSRLTVIEYPPQVPSLFVKLDYITVCDDYFQTSGTVIK